jgi:thiamine-monophosphate kinase
VKLSDLGEFGFIARLARPFLSGLPRGVKGIGDDCAVLPWTKKEHLLVTTDMLVEDRHFLRSGISARDLGYKSLAVSLSDIAAMGGRPRWAFLSMGIPSGIELAWLDGFFRGWREAAKPSGAILLGGDTTKSPDRLVVNVVVLGTVRPGREKFRSAARPGDIVAVTGNLGDSGAGLNVLLNGGPRDRDERRLLRAHNRPLPHLKEGEWLASRSGVQAMMDVSDGLDSDIRRIMGQSNVGADIELDRLPISPTLVRVARRRDWNSVESAAVGGEDYCLLLTVDPSRFKSLAALFARRFGRPLSAVGMIRPRSRGLRYFSNGRAARLEGCGFDHFRIL